MTFRPRLLVLSGALVALGLVAMTQLRATTKQQSIPRVGVIADKNDHRFVVGSRLVFSLKANAVQRVPILPSVAGDLVVDARLELDIEEMDESRGVARIQLRPEQPFKFEILGGSLLGANESTAAIAGRVRWDRHGTVEEIEVATGVSEVQSALLSALLTQIFAANQCRSDVSVTAVSLGLGVGRYALGRFDGKSRSRKLASLSASLPYAIGDPLVVVHRGDGHVECERGLPLKLTEASDAAVLDGEGVAVAGIVNEVQLRLLTIQKGPHGELLQPLRKLSPALTSPTRALERRAGDLSGAQVVEDLRRFANAGRMLDTPRWLWKATARMALEPRHLEALGGLLASESLADTGRAFVTDLIAFTPAPEAQDILRSALSRPILGVDETEHALLLQRFAFVSKPNLETLSWLDGMRKMSRHGGPEWQAATLALGSAIGRLESSQPEQRRYLAILIGELDASDDEVLLAYRLRALGNTALGAPVLHIRSRVGHSSELVRAAVASALRSHTDDESRGALLGLAGDPAPFVQRHALESLRTRYLTPSDYRALGHILARIPESMLNDATNFLAARRSLATNPSENSSWHALAKILVQRVKSDGPVGTRLAELLRH